MSSIIDRIAEAEERAEKLRYEAAAKARESVQQAEAKVRLMKSNEMEQARKRLSETIEKAEKDGVITSGSILEKARKKADAEYTEAQKRMPSVVSYLIERVMS